MRFRKAFLITLVVQGIIFILSLINGVLLTRVIGTEGRGIYSLLTATVGLLALFMGGGLNFSNTYYTGKDKEKVSIILSNSVVFGIAICILIWLLYFALPQKSIDLIFKEIDKSYINVAIFLVIITIFSAYLNAIYLGLQEFKYYNLFPLIQIVSFLVLNIIFLYIYNFRVSGVIYAWLFSSIIGLICNITFIFNKIKNFKFSPKLRHLFESLKVGYRALIVNIFGMLLLRSDIFLIKYFLGLKAVGIYSVAVFVAELMLKIPSIAGTVLFPKISSGVSKENIELTLKVSRFIGLSVILVSVGLLLSGSFLLPFAFGKEFKDSYIPMVWLLPGIIGLGFRVILGNFYAGRGYPFIVIFSSFVALVINITLNLILIPLYGIKGAAISTSISYLVLTLIESIYFSKQFSIPLTRIIFLYNKRDFSIIKEVYISKFVK